MTATEFSKLTGVTNRQLQWWDERGYVKPILHENPRGYTERIYSPEQANLLFLIAQFRSKRLSLQRIVRGLPKLRKFAERPGWVLALRSGFTGTQDKAELLKIAAKHKGPVLLAGIQ